MPNSNKSAPVIPSLRASVIAAINDQPMLLSVNDHFELAEMLANVRSGSVQGEGLQKESKDRMAAMFLAPDDGDDDPIDYDLPYLLKNGVAYIPIQGVLLNRLSFSGWGVTGYDYLQAAITSAQANPAVSAMMFDINSPGGMVQGNFELCDFIANLPNAKPMACMVNANCCSGAYSLAAAIGNISAIPSSDVGSIGVYTIHMDATEALAQMGLKMTIIRAGDRKIEGNPYEPLSDDALANIQAEVDTSYQAFTNLVADYRGLTQQAVIDTQAAVYSADQALSLGLIDSVSNVQDALAAFATELSGSSISNEDIPMDPKDKNAGADAAQAEAVRLATAKAVSDDRERRKAITNNEEAVGREKLAAHLADNSDMSVDEAVALLKVSAKEAKAEVTVVDKKVDANGKTTPFEQHMANTDNPNVQRENNDDAQKAELKGSAKLLAAANKAGMGKRFRQPA